jgi:hypothetical protein
MTRIYGPCWPGRPRKIVAQATAEFFALDYDATSPSTDLLSKGSLECRSACLNAASRPAPYRTNGASSHTAPVMTTMPIRSRMMP